jgi:heme exporter protein B
MKRKPASAAGGYALVSALASHLRKDLRIEFRSRYALNIALSFAVVSTLSISLTAAGALLKPSTHAILLWIILFFSAMNGLAHVFIREEEEETALFLALTSAPAVIFTAKLAFNMLMILGLALVISPLYVFFMDMRVAAPLVFAFTVASGGIAIASCTTLLAAMVAKAGGKGALFTIISFPLVLPVLWVSMRATAMSLEKPDYAGLDPLLFLLAFSGALIAVSYMLFEHIWTGE